MSAKSHIRRQNLARRALYGLQASRRVSQAVLQGKPLKDSVNREKAHFRAHKQASAKRLVAASQVDALGTPVVSWRAVLDERTTPECRFAHGKNFAVNNPPRIGYPGTTHMHCRCVPGPAVPGADSL